MNNTKINDKKTIFGWYMYDWSASAYNLTITSTIFPIYFTSVVLNKNGGDIVSFLGCEVRNSALYSYSLSFVFLMVVLLNPILTAICDYTGHKKSFMKFFCFVGAASCGSMYLFDNQHIYLGVFGFILAGIGYNCSWVFYNSYLPEIASKDKFDKISAIGYAFGYVGSVLLLLFNLSMLLFPAYYSNITSEMASKISFLSVGLWWFLFSLVTFYFLPKDVPISTENTSGWILNGFKELKKVFFIASKIKSLKLFLIAFFLYNLGVQTFMYVATVFSDKELHMPTDALIATVLILQFVAIPGAYLSSFISKKFGNNIAIILQLFIWIGICFGAYVIETPTQFYVLAFFVGLVMGGIQSISRSTFAKFIPSDTTDNASFFSLYECVDKTSIVFGTLIYGLCDTITGSARSSVLILGLFFFFAILILRKIIKLNPYKILT